jgi:molecular chaperone IbpA
MPMVGSTLVNLLKQKEKTMTKLTSLDLTPFYRQAIGIDSLFDRLMHNIDLASSNANNYPPYNIVKTNEDSYEIQIAVAGFAEGEVEINFHEGQLVITGEKNTDDSETQYLHRGISARKFIRTFQLSDYVEVREAGMKDGILTVSLQRIVPEEMKPKRIAISYTK